MILRKVSKDKFIIPNPKDLNVNNINQLYGKMKLKKLYHL